ncbi:hypothetical protein Tco_1267755, partial [Tanacetum coccineum]
SNIALSLQQENRLKQMGATVRNASSYMERLKLNEQREKLARVCSVQSLDPFDCHSDFGAGFS